jgi:signal transduction histidine kinase
MRLPGLRSPHLRALESFSREAQRIVELDQFASRLTELIVPAFQTSAACLMLPAYGSGDFVIVSSVGSTPLPYRLCLKEDDLLLCWLKQSDGVVHFRDLDTIPQLQALPAREKEELSRIGAELFIPLKNQDRLVGILILGPKQHGKRFLKKDINPLKALCPRMAKGLENACLYHQVSERAGQLTLIAELGKVIASGLDYQAVFEGFINKLKRFIDAALAAILSIEGKELKVLALLTELELPWKIGDTFPIEGTATAWLAANRKAIIESDLDQQRRFSTGELLLQQKIRSVVYLPLLCRGQFLGSFILGSLRPASYKGKELVILEQLGRYIVIAIENSRLYNLEKEQRARLEAVDQQRYAFLSAISHELRTPITSLKISTEILAKEHDIAQDGLGAELLDNIHCSVQRMERRVSELLDFVHLQGAGLELTPEPFDLHKVFEEAIALIIPLTLSKKQTLDLEIAQSLPVVMLDKQRLEQILLNLLSNASKYTPGGGHIKVTARIENHNLLVQVIDSGYGIPLSEQALIFKPYYYSRTRSETPSLGIGLAITKSLVELQGGKIWVESQAGRGSTFSFILPLEPPQKSGEKIESTDNRG